MQAYVGTRNQQSHTKEARYLSADGTMSKTLAAQLRCLLMTLFNYTSSGRDRGLPKIFGQSTSLVHWYSLVQSNAMSECAEPLQTRRLLALQQYINHQPLYPSQGLILGNIIAPHSCTDPGNSCTVCSQAQVARHCS